MDYNSSRSWLLLFCLFVFLLWGGRGVGGVFFLFGGTGRCCVWVSPDVTQCG